MYSAESLLYTEPPNWIPHFQKCILKDSLLNPPCLLNNTQVFRTQWLKFMTQPFHCWKEDCPAAAAQDCIATFVSMKPVDILKEDVKFQHISGLQRCANVSSGNSSETDLDVQNQGMSLYRKAAHMEAHFLKPQGSILTNV